MRKTLWILPLIIGITQSLLISCTPEEKTGPKEVRWDRTSCELCQMAVSDHFYSAQIRGGAGDRPTQVYYFDDLGCATLWLVDQDWKSDPRTEIWVNDHKTGEWLNAREAAYTTGNITPMDFGLGATLQSAKNTLNYQQAVKHIYQDEERKQQKRARDINKPLSQNRDN